MIYASASCGMSRVGSMRLRSQTLWVFSRGLYDCISGFYGEFGDFDS